MYSVFDPVNWDNVNNEIQYIETPEAEATVQTHSITWCALDLPCTQCSMNANFGITFQFTRSWQYPQHTWWESKHKQLDCNKKNTKRAIPYEFNSKYFRFTCITSYYYSTDTLFLSILSVDTSFSNIHLLV